MNKINIIAVGDGNNDIPMLKTSTVGIGVKNGLNTNVVSNSQITISRFKDLLKVNKNAYFCYTHNYNSIYSVFYKINVWSSISEKLNAKWLLTYMRTHRQTGIVVHRNSCTV